MSRYTETPDTIYVSVDRRWAKMETPICTQRFVRAALAEAEIARLREENATARKLLWECEADEYLPRSLLVRIRAALARTQEPIDGD